MILPKFGDNEQWIDDQVNPRSVLPNCADRDSARRIWRHFRISQPTFSGARSVLSDCRAIDAPAFILLPAKPASPLAFDNSLIFLIYFFILVTHILLAAAIVPLVIVTLVRAIKGKKSDDYSRHKKIAKWTWPIWMYVSVTGIMVYLMLYRL